MGHDRRFERRDSSRPVNGDTKCCPQCGGMMEFSERFRFDHGMMPGWVCENAACPVKRFPARRVDVLPAPLRRLALMANAASARALRTIMKSKARIARIHSGKRRAS
jgi:hypothetical protein